MLLADIKPGDHMHPNTAQLWLVSPGYAHPGHLLHYLLLQVTSPPHQKQGLGRLKPIRYSLHCCMQSSEDPMEFLDFPVVSLMTLGKDGNFPHLVAVARRQLPDATQESIRWYGELGHLTDQHTCIALDMMSRKVLAVTWLAQG
jgi:hypothetical protein